MCNKYNEARGQSLRCSASKKIHIVICRRESDLFILLRLSVRQLKQLALPLFAPRSIWYIWFYLRIVYGGMDANFVHASQTEMFLVGKSMADHDIFMEALGILAGELVRSNKRFEKIAQFIK